MPDPLQVVSLAAVAAVCPLQASAPRVVVAVFPLQASAPRAAAAECPLQVSAPRAAGAVYLLPVLPWPLLAPPQAEVPDAVAVASRLLAAFRAVVAESHPWAGAEYHPWVAAVCLHHFCRSVQRWP
jgi:hypothetical protein